MTAGDILEGAAVLLNDEERFLQTDEVLLPCLKKAWTEFTLRIKEYGLQAVQEISAVVDIPTSKTTITSTDITDLSTPNSLYERLDGSSELFVPMTEVYEEPQRDKETTLREWCWRENEIKLVGATTAREVKVSYIKGLSAITTVNSLITITDAQLFLESRTAAIASARSGNFDRAQLFSGDAEAHFQSYLNAQIKSKQRAIRHKGFRR